MMMLEYYLAYRKAEKNLPAALPNFSNNICTAYLKVKIGEKHRRALGYDEWDCIVGIRYDELRRYSRMINANEYGNARWDSVCPSYVAGIIKDGDSGLLVSVPLRLRHGFGLRQLRPGLEEERGQADGPSICRKTRPR